VKVTRREFFERLAGGTVLLTLQACGGDGGSGNAGFGAGCGATGAAIVGNHASPYAHTLTVPAADLRSGVDHTYSTEGTTDHVHTVSFTAAELLALANNGPPIKKVSGSASSVNFVAHIHSITVTC
jgi:hypothetical protein